MQTSTLYHGFALQHTPLLNTLTGRVREAAAVETLYLLGLTLTHRRTETLFSVPSVSRTEVSHAFLLAVVEEEADGGRVRAQDKIEGALQSLVPATVMVFTAAQFYRWLVEGHPFAAAVGEKGYLLYKGEEAGTVLPKPVDREGLAATNARLLAQTNVRVQEFLAGAELYTVRVQYKLAAFLLHQAAEQTLRTALILATGLRLNTHSLQRLVRCCTLFSAALPALFEGSEADQRLFGLLQKAYIDSRYGDDYAIKGEELARLTGKVKTLYTLLLEEAEPSASPAQSPIQNEAYEP